MGDFTSKDGDMQQIARTWTFLWNSGLLFLEPCLGPLVPGCWTLGRWFQHILNDRGNSGKWAAKVGRWSCSHRYFEGSNPGIPVTPKYLRFMDAHPPISSPKKRANPHAGRLQVKLHLTMKHDHICEAKLRVLVVRKWGMPYAAFGTALCAMPVCPRKPQVSQNLRVTWCCMGFRGTNAQYFPPKVRPSLLGWWLCLTNDYCCKTGMDAKLIIIVDVYSWRW